MKHISEVLKRHITETASSALTNQIEGLLYAYFLVDYKPNAFDRIVVNDFPDLTSEQFIYLTAVKAIVDEHSNTIFGPIPNRQPDRRPIPDKETLLWRQLQQLIQLVTQVDPTLSALRNTLINTIEQCRETGFHLSGDHAIHMNPNDVYRPLQKFDSIKNLS